MCRWVAGWLQLDWSCRTWVVLCKLVARLLLACPTVWPTTAQCNSATLLPCPLAQLAGIRCRRCSLLPNSIADESPTTLVLRGFTAVPGWFADLLAAATPPSVAPEALFLSRVRFSAAALRGCTQLAALRALELSHVSCDDAAAAALFDCVPQLSALSMDVSLAAVNSALFSQPRPQLSRLELYGSLHTSLHSLAPGLSLLSGLQYLVSIGCTGALGSVEMHTGLVEPGRLLACSWWNPVAAACGSAPGCDRRLLACCWWNPVAAACGSAPGCAVPLLPMVDQGVPITTAAGLPLPAQLEAERRLCGAAGSPAAPAQAVPGAAHHGEERGRGALGSAAPPAGPVH